MVHMPAVPVACAGEQHGEHSGRSSCISVSMYSRSMVMVAGHSIGGHQVTSVQGTALYTSHSRRAQPFCTVLRFSVFLDFSGFFTQVTAKILKIKNRRLKN